MLGRQSHRVLKWRNSSLWKLNSEGLILNSRRVQYCRTLSIFKSRARHNERTNRVATRSPAILTADSWIAVASILIGVIGCARSGDGRLNFKRLSLSLSLSLSRTRALLSGDWCTTYSSANYSSKHAGMHTWCHEPQVSNQGESATMYTRERKSARERERERERERARATGFGTSYVGRTLGMIRRQGRYSIISVIPSIVEERFR